MNVNKIISELREHQVVDELPQEHHVQRREQEYEDRITRSEPNYFPHRENDWEETPRRYPNIEDHIWIPEGDIDEFPDIGVASIERRVIEEGTDVLAWYRSFHWYPPNHWGIYILDKGVYYLAQNVFRDIEQICPYGRHYNTLDLLQQSFRLLFLHEFFHFITDIAASTLEVGTSFRSHNYIDYVRNVYMHPHNTGEPIEEALANSFAYNRFQGRNIRYHIRVFMKNQPNGYSAFDQYLGRNFPKGRRELGTSIRDGRGGGRSFAPLESLFDCRYQDVFFGDVPIYIVQTIRPPQYIIKFVRSIPRSAIVQSSTFQSDIQRMPPQIISKYEKALQMLEYNVRHRGLNFEKIKGCDTVFTIRIDRNYRLSMRPLNGQWELLRIAEHDEIYRNPGGC